MTGQTELDAIGKAQSKRLPITKNLYGQTMIDGMRWDLWLKYGNREVTTFRGRELIKEV